MRQTILVLTILTLIISRDVTLAAEVSSDKLMDMLKKLQEQVANQQKEIEILNKKLDKEKEGSSIAEGELQSRENRILNPTPASEENVSQQLNPDQVETDEDILQQGYAVIKEVAGVKLGKGISGLSLKGDARFRYEARERDRNGSEDSRDRFRIRLRLGAVWHNVDDSWEIGVGLATGGTGNESSTSTNQSFSKDGVFQTNDINLDYAYARHSWDYVDLTIGQQINPWKKSTTFMMWDSDVRPVGITGTYHWEELFFTGGIYDVLGAEGDDNSEALMFAGQAGYKADLDTMQFLIAGGLWAFNDTAYEAVNNFFNGPDRHSGLLNNQAQFTIGDVYGQFNMEIDEELKFQTHFHVAINFGADDAGGSQLGQPGINPEDEDLAWLIGGKGSWGPVELSLNYAHIEADSVFAPIKDSDFGDTAGMTVTDVEGIKLGLKYKFSKTLSLGGTYMDLNEIEGTPRDAQLYQLDLVYKF